MDRTAHSQLPDPMTDRPRDVTLPDYALTNALRHERDVFKQSATEQLEVASRLAQEAQQTRDVLRRIKNMVCGEKNPRWSDQWATTNTRAAIADLCDSILNPSA